MGVWTISDAQRFPGRQAQLGALSELVEGARERRGGAIVVSGEPGVGKTTLIGHALANRLDVSVLRVAGVQFEKGFAFAAVHRLFQPLLAESKELAEPILAVLETAFGMREGRVPDADDVGAALLGLLSEAASGGPVVCVIDDAQWVDDPSARALAFLAEAIAAEPVAMIFALPEAGTVPALAALPQVQVARLSAEDARALLAAEFHAPLDRRVRERIIAEARGNPLALLELPHRSGPGHFAGGFGLPDAAPPADGVEDGFRERLTALPDATRLLLLLAAADPLGDQELLWRAADSLGVGSGAAAPARDAGLLGDGEGVIFRHPLVRSAVYRAAGGDDRRRVHRALAEATDPALDPERRIWHHAQAAAGPDKQIAGDLEYWAVNVQSRGGVAASAAFTGRSAALTADRELRAERLLAAARSKIEAGALDDAEGLLSAAEASSLSARQRAHRDRLLGRIAFLSRNMQPALDLQLKAAAQFARLDPSLARACHLDAIETGMLAGRTGDAMMVTIREASAAPPAPGTPTSADLLLDALVALYTGDRRRGLAILAPILDDTRNEVWLRHPLLGCLLAGEAWHIEAFVNIASWQVESARSTGSVSTIPIGLMTLTAASVWGGDTPGEMALLSLGESLADVTGLAQPCYARVVSAAFHGFEPAASRQIRAIEVEARKRGEGLTVSCCAWAEAVLGNALADYPRALAAARAATSYREAGIHGQSLLELTEAAVRCGDRDAALSAYGELVELTGSPSAGWGAEVQACAAALVAENDVAEQRYRDALTLLGAGHNAVWIGRTHLLFGEWLRRQGRRREAREQLGRAHDVFAASGLAAFAKRAAAEMQATGEKARSRGGAATDELTAQETAIVQLVVAGATNREIAAKMFLSPRTIDTHLRSIFRKLGVTSRRQLRDL